MRKKHKPKKPIPETKIYARPEGKHYHLKQGCPLLQEGDFKRLGYKEIGMEEVSEQGLRPCVCAYEDKELTETLSSGNIRLTEKGRVKAKALKKKKYPHRKKFGIWYRIFRFFCPKDFKGEVKRGMKIGKGSKIAEKLGGGLYDLGKAIRRKVDPEHKMKIGKERRRK